MEITLFRVPAGLGTPAGEGGIQEGVNPFHGGLQTDCGPVGHMQLYHNAAALNQVQLLSQNLLITVCTVRLAKPGHQETFLVVETPKVR